MARALNSPESLEGLRDNSLCMSSLTPGSVGLIPLCQGKWTLADVTHPTTPTRTAACDKGAAARSDLKSLQGSV